MYTQCPHCRTVHQPTAAALAQDRGRLLCEQCGHGFDALERLSEQPPGSQPTLFDPVQGALFPELAAPDFHRPRGRGRLLAQLAGVLALALLLVLQITLAERERFARDPALLPWVERVAALAGLDLPRWRDPARIELTARDVRPHPSVPDALLVSASFRNAAPRPQAWPVLELALSDIHGKPLGLRRFSADEYLGAAPASATLAAGQAAVATLELRDPGKDAIAFAFEFR